MPISIAIATLFGSQARGDAELGSDIDVLVVLKAPVNPGEEIKRTGKAVADLSLHYDVVAAGLVYGLFQHLRQPSPAHSTPPK